MAQRFLTLADVAEELAVSVAQVRVLVRSGELPAIQVGGRNQWRVEITALEEYIQQQYARTRERIEGGRVMDDSPSAGSRAQD
jgi:excisionase family DNA binding protein